MQYKTYAQIDIIKSSIYELKFRTKIDNKQLEQNTNEHHIIPFKYDEVDSPTNTSKVHNLGSEIEHPYQICIGDDHVDNVTEIKVGIRGTHKIL